MIDLIVTLMKTDLPAKEWIDPVPASTGLDGSQVSTNHNVRPNYTFVIISRPNNYFYRMQLHYRDPVPPRFSGQSHRITKFSATDQARL